MENLAIVDNLQLTKLSTISRVHCTKHLYPTKASKYKYQLMKINVSSLTNNGVCDESIKDNLDCNYDLPDCKNQYESSATCPFLELHSKLSCEAANKILNISPKCSQDNIR